MTFNLAPCPFDFVAPGVVSDSEFYKSLQKFLQPVAPRSSQRYLAFDEKYLVTDEFDAVLDRGEKLAGQIAAFNRSVGITDKKTNLPS